MKDVLAHVFTSTLTGRWGDMDAFGHVNNAKYLTYCEHARIEWLHSLGMSAESQDGTGPVIVTADLTFLKPLVTPAEVVVELYAGQPGRSSFMTYHEIFSEGVLYCTCAVKIVWVNYAEGRSVSLPESYRLVLE